MTGHGRHSSSGPPPADETPEQTIARLERAQRTELAAPRGIPVWVTIIVVLALTGLLAWNIVVVGPEGLPTSYILGGLLGAYAGLDQLVKRRDGGGPPTHPSDDQHKAP